MTISPGRRYHIRPNTKIAYRLVGVGTSDDLLAFNVVKGREGQHQQQRRPPLDPPIVHGTSIGRVVRRTRGARGAT